MSNVVRTETKTSTSISGGVKTTTTETIETLASGQVRTKTETVTENHTGGCPQQQMQCGAPKAVGGCKPVQVPAKSESPKAKVKPGDFAESALKRHNHFRAQHGVPPLKLNSKICAYSQEWANYLAGANRFEHRSEHKYGENIYMKMTSDPNHQLDGGEAVDSWYSEIKDHTFGQEPRSMGTGHFTQVVWKGSKELGIAMAKGSGGRYYVVANYDPPGNYVGQYTPNVPPKK